MSEISLVTDMKDVLTSCPVCSKPFDESYRVPRRMPCCVEAVCEPCLAPLYSNGRLTCPLCHRQHSGYKGVQTLPVEQLILKMLSQMNVNKSHHLPCTYCPLNNTAIAKCGHCSVLLCQACLRTHSKNKLLKDHSVIMFEDIRDHRMNGPGSLSRTLSVQSMNLLSQLKEKDESLRSRMEELQELQKNIALSRRRAKEDINMYFDNLATEMQQRKSLLISQVEERADEEETILTRVIESRNGLQGRIKKVTKNSRSRKSLSSSDIWDLLAEYPEDVEFTRKGVSFVTLNAEHISSLIKTTGLVRTVTFLPADKPEGVPDAVMYNNIHVEAADGYDGNDGDTGVVCHATMRNEQTCSLGDKIVVLETERSPQTVSCPYLEWDTSTASKTVTTSGTVITNARPEHPLTNSGCRVQAERHVMASRPLLLGNDQRVMFQMKLSYTLKMLLQENKMLFEASLTETPIESAWSQPNGLSINVASCADHQQQLCLRVVYDNKLLEDMPIAQNEVGVSRGLHLCFLLNTVKNEIHVIDVEDDKVISTVTDVDMDRPLWLMSMLSWPSWANMAVAMISGTRVDVTKDMYKLLTSLSNE
ncbi:uncharacterized protein LOC124121315 [Haliotis rufescens]|uniref:uncharacterized protein LOC124121315 n=1 Tax=Haliotis rufescens TaxID=6454 RepID=UPI00201FA944|nr:uncharacterized protein LOC124121315 [Haliotis rufescens]